MRPAAFLDRDGTIIELVHHLNDPSDVCLISGAGQAIMELNKAQIPVIVVTNQSVIGRGKLTEAGLARVHDQMNAQLARDGAKVDGIYFCPVAPTIKDPQVIEHPNRKPGPGMLITAAEEMNLDLSQSVMVGDTISDMLAGRNGKVGHTILVRTGYGTRVPLPDPAIDYHVADMAEAGKLISTLLLSGKTA